MLRGVAAHTMPNLLALGTEIVFFGIPRIDLSRWFRVESLGFRGLGLE